MQIAFLKRTARKKTNKKKMKKNVTSALLLSPLPRNLKFIIFEMFVS